MGALESIESTQSTAPPYSGATGVIFIVGDPVAQVLAPAGLTDRLRERGADLIVVPAHVAAPDFAAFVATAGRMRNCAGIIVTVPHKFAARKLCRTTTEQAGRVGAVNLMRRSDTEAWFGAMTDGKGVVRTLRRKGFDPTGKRGLLVGAGGAGAAVAHALAESGIGALMIHDVDPSRAQTLRRQLLEQSGFEAGTGSKDPTGFDLVVNATFLGTSPHDPLPIDELQLTPDAFVADLSTGSDESAVITAARRRGCRTMTGKEMFATMCDTLADFFLSRTDIQG